MSNTTSTGSGDNPVAVDRISGADFQRMKLVQGAEGIVGDITADSPLPVAIYDPSGVSTSNSTTANLAGGAAFTGSGEDVHDYSMITVSVYSSHASATDGLQLQQSSDGTNWDLVDAFSIPATTGKTFSAAVQAQFFRLVYTNGATLTTSLRIQTIYSTLPKKSSSVRPQDARTNDNDFEEAIAYNAMFNGVSWDRARGESKTWVVSTGNTSHVAAATTTLLDLFNASGSGVILRVLGVYIIPALAAVTGVGMTYSAIRTSAVGTGGSTATPVAFDTSNTALHANVTARIKPAGGATTSATLLTINGSSEETSPYASQASVLNHVPQHPQAQPLILREGQGLKIDQTTNSSVGNVNVVIVFTNAPTSP